MPVTRAEKLRNQIISASRPELNYAIGLREVLVLKKILSLTHQSGKLTNAEYLTLMELVDRCTIRSSIPPQHKFEDIENLKANETF